MTPTIFAAINYVMVSNSSAIIVPRQSVRGPRKSVSLRQLTRTGTNRRNFREHYVLRTPSKLPVVVRVFLVSRTPVLVGTLKASDNAL